MILYATAGQQLCSSVIFTLLFYFLAEMKIPSQQAFLVNTGGEPIAKIMLLLVWPFDVLLHPV
jgi:hypothetical protein